jgi:LPS sulfotransferase NodH
VRGIKLRLPQVDEFGLSLSSLERQPVPLRFLLLYREDLAEQYVSQRIADRTDRWILRGDAPASNETVRVDADDAVGYFDAIRERFAQLEGDAWLRERSLWVRYEDLARSPQALFDRAITPWLGIEPAPVSAPDRRMNPKPLRAKVENWAEARGALEGPRARLAPPSGWSRATI